MGSQPHTPTPLTELAEPSSDVELNVPSESPDETRDFSEDNHQAEKQQLGVANVSEHHQGGT